MKKIYIKIILIAIVIIITLGISFELLVTNKNNNSDVMEDVEIVEMTREEYLQIKAEVEGISFDEADIVEKLQTEESINNEFINNLKSYEIMPIVNTMYKKIKIIYEVGSSEKFNSTVVSTMNVKILKYSGLEYGTYQKFTEVLDKDVQADGVGTVTYRPGTMTALIDYDTGNENSIIFMFSGIIEHKIGLISAQSAKKSGFMVDGISPVIASKYFEEKTIFSSNLN